MAMVCLTHLSQVAGTFYMFCMPHIPPLFEASSGAIEMLGDGMPNPSESCDKHL